MSVVPRGLVASTYALYVAVSFNGEVVEEQSVRYGESVQLGNSALVAVPVPEGHDHLARVVWTGPATAVVETVQGTVHEVTPGEDLEIEVGPVGLRLYLVEQFRIRRSNTLSSVAALAWFVVVMMAFLVISKLEWFDRPENNCLVLDHVVRDYAVYFPNWYERCHPQTAPMAHGGNFSAEYIARLLKKDFDGSDRGLIETIDNIDRPDAEREIDDEDPHVFLPAGDVGPPDEMGGAEETAPEPVRSVDDEDLVLPKQEVEEEVQLALEDSEVVDDPVEVREPEDGEDEGLKDVPEEEDDKSAERTAEEEEGWGVPDWYDERDAKFEDFVIQYQLQYVKERLAIDPDDLDALSALSYFQYLAQDYDGAVETYNKIIDQIPEDPSGYNNKALIYKRRGEYQKEEALYRIALSMDPTDDIVMNNLAVNLSHQGRFDEALAIMDQLEQMVPGDAYANLHRSKIYAEMGDDEQAYHYLRKALEGFNTMDTLHRIEFRQDIRIDPSFARLREQRRFRSTLAEFFGKDVPLPPE